jgi:prepilin-type N-terminal cleavage/methylation domain-containing protein
MKRLYPRLPGVLSSSGKRKNEKRTALSGNHKGFTLVEVLITLIITAVLVSAGYGIYLNQHEGWIIQEQITNMQQNARAAMHELETTIRMAGYGLPGGFHCIYAANTNPDTITVLFKNEFGCQATTDHTMPLASSELSCDGQDVSCFYENTWAYVYDPGADTGEFFYITDVQIASHDIEHNTAPLSRCYPSGSLVMYLDFYKFYIDTTDRNHPNLMMKRIGEPSYVYAEDIEDLQFRYGLATGVYADIPPAASVVREVRVSLVARTEKKDLQFVGEYRRRALTSEVKVRNLGL